jgi:DNA-directed RNA polymerase subunit RPC12/RpoP
MGTDMRIVDAIWTPRVNVYRVACGCGRDFQHPADRWSVRCPVCGAWRNLARLRWAWGKERGVE